MENWYHIRLAYVFSLYMFSTKQISAKDRIWYVKVRWQNTTKQGKCWVPLFNFITNNVILLYILYFRYPSLSEKRKKNFLSLPHHWIFIFIAFFSLDIPFLLSVYYLDAHLCNLIHVIISDSVCVHAICSNCGEVYTERF